MAEIIWHHPDNLIEHLKLVEGVILVESRHWLRCQQWDNIYSFYDPDKRAIIVREDQLENAARFEMAFLVALGQSLCCAFGVYLYTINVWLDHLTGDRTSRQPVRTR